MREGWSVLDDGEDDDGYPFADSALPMDLLEGLVNKLVAQRCRKLDARLSDLQLEVKSQASEIASLRVLVSPHFGAVALPDAAPCVVAAATAGCHVEAAHLDVQHHAEVGIEAVGKMDRWMKRAAAECSTPHVASGSSVCVRELGIQAQHEEKGAAETAANSHTTDKPNGKRSDVTATTPADAELHASSNTIAPGVARDASHAHSNVSQTTTKLKGKSKGQHGGASITQLVGSGSNGATGEGIEGAVMLQSNGATLGGHDAH